MSERPCPPPVPPPCPSKGETSEKEKETKNNEEVKETKKCFQTLNFDPRFPNQNQTKRCWVNYVDYIRCQEKFGEDYEQCEVFKKVYSMLCPQDWIDNWDEQRENGTFPMPNW